MAVETFGPAPLPSFVIIGAPGCATRWLRFNLDRHPEIFAPPRFDRCPPLFLFDEERLNGDGLRAYRREFVGWRGEPIVGALEPRCMLKQTRTEAEGRPLPAQEGVSFQLADPNAAGLVVRQLAEPQETARRMLIAMPDCRLVLMVRNPIDRLEVDFRHAVELGKLPPDADLAAMLNAFDLRLVNLDIYAGGMYSEPIDEFRQRFGDQLLVQFYDDVVTDPAGVYRTVLEHVGASPDFVPPDLERVRYGPHDTSPAVRLGPKDRQKLYDFAYRVQVSALEKRLGRDLSAWDPTYEAVA